MTDLTDRTTLPANAVADKRTKYTEVLRGPHQHRGTGTSSASSLSNKYL